MNPTLAFTILFGFIISFIILGYILKKLNSSIANDIKTLRAGSTAPNENSIEMTLPPITAIQQKTNDDLEMKNEVKIYSDNEIFEELKMVSRDINKQQEITDKVLQMQRELTETLLQNESNLIFSLKIFNDIRGEVIANSLAIERLDGSLKKIAAFAPTPALHTRKPTGSSQLKNNPAVKQTLAQRRKRATDL